MKKDYKGVAWTDHAIERMRARGIKQGDAWATFNRPQLSKKALAKDAFVYYRTFGYVKIEVVAKKVISRDPKQESKWVILSVWSKKVHKKKQKKSNGLIKLVKKLKGFVNG
jgi:hypothetical protein